MLLYAHIHTAQLPHQESPPDIPDSLFLDFSKTGNRKPYETANGLLDDRLAAFVLAECLENEGASGCGTGGRVTALALTCASFPQ